MEDFKDVRYNFENPVTFNTRLGYLREGDQVISIDRDYTDTISPQFSLAYPTILEDRISEEDFTRVVTTINKFLSDAEAIRCETLCEGILGYLTCFVTTVLCTNHYEKCLQQMTKYINEQNDYFADYGLVWLNPTSNGLLHLDVLLKARKSGMMKFKTLSDNSKNNKKEDGNKDSIKIDINNDNTPEEEGEITPLQSDFL